jgi:hypothetical protein
MLKDNSGQAEGFLNEFARSASLPINDPRMVDV